MLEIKKYIRTLFGSMPIENHVEVVKQKDAIIRKKNNEIMLLKRQIVALEKDIEYRARERVIDQSMIVDLLAYTKIPVEVRKDLELKVDKQKAYIRQHYGRKHPDDKYNPCSID